MSRTPQPQEVSDRRDAPRIALEGQYSLRIDPCDGREPITCVLLDYSVTGMRVELPQELALPTNVHVVIGKIAHNARIVWRKGNVAGVDLVDEHHSIY